MAGEITFIPEAADQVAVARGSFLRRLKRRRFIVRAVLLLGLSVVMGAGLNVLDGRAGIGWIAFAAGTAVAWLIVILLGTYLLLPRLTTRLFRQQRSLDRTYTFVWDDTGVVFTSAASRSEVSWSEYHHWFEDRRVFAFGLNEQLFHWAPKRAMTADAIEELRRTVVASGLSPA